MNSEGTRPAGNRGAHRASPRPAAAVSARAKASSQGIDRTSWLQHDHCLQQIVDDGMALLKADAAVIELREGDAWRVVFQRGLQATDAGALLSPEKAPVAAHVAASLAPIAIADLPQSAQAKGSYLLDKGARSIVAVPLVVPDEPLGVVIFLVCGAPDRRPDASSEIGEDPGKRATLEEERIQLAADIAIRVAAAMRAALLVEAERRTNRRLADVLDGMYDGFIALDDQWRYTVVNRAAEALSGRPAAELLGQSMEELYPDLPSWPYYREVVAKQKPIAFETWSPVLEAWLEIHAYPTSEGVSILFSDISERKAAERALAQTRELLDAHIDNSPLAVIEFDPQFRIIRWSNGAGRMFGWVPEEVLGKTLRELRWVYEEDADLVIAESAGLLSGERPRSLNTNRNYRKDGSIIWCEWYNSAVYDEEGKLVSVLSQVLDVTRRKQAEQALRDSEEKYRRLFDNMTEEVHFWQVVRGEAGEIRTWRLVDANPPTLKTWGVEDVEQIRGKTTDEIFGPGATDHYMDVVRKVMDLGAAHSYEDYFPNLDKWFRFTTVGFGDYFITTGADITDIKRAADIQRATSRILHAGLTADSNEELGRVALEEAQSLTRSVFGFIGEIGADDALRGIALNMPEHAPSAAGSEKVRRRRPPVDVAVQQLCARVIVEGEPLLTNEPGGIGTRAGTPQGHPSLTSFLGVPLASFERTEGVIAVANGVGGFRESDVSALEALAPAIVAALERRQTEKALRETRDDLERAQAVANVGSWRLNTQRNKLEWSAETYRMFGVPQGEGLSYDFFLSLLHPDDRARVDESWQAAVRQEREYDIEHRVVVDGETKWVRERAELEFDENRGLLGGFGTVQDITRLKTAQAQLQWVARRLELLADAARLLLSAERPEDAVQEIAERVCGFLGCDVFFNYLMQEDREGMRLNAYQGVSKKIAGRIDYLRLGDAVCGCVGRDGARIVAEDVQHSSDERADLVRSFGIQAYACHPLIVRGETIGTLSFGTKARASFTADELELMRVVSDQAATAMARKQAEDRLRASREKLAAERTRLRTIIDNVPMGITLLDASGEIIEINRANREIRGDESLAPAESPTAKTLKTGERAEAIADIERADGVEATLKLTAAPIIDDEGELAGVVELTEDVTTEVEEQRLNEALAAIATTISGTLDGDEIVRRLVGPAVLALRVDTGAFSVREREQWVVKEFFGPTRRKPTSSMADPLLEQAVLAAELHQPIAIDDVATDERVTPSVMRRLGIRSLLAVPLMVQNRVVGVLGFHHRQRTRAFTPAQVAFARKLRDTASLALENARLYERERTIAETLQQAILAPLPELNGLASAYLYRPASDAVAVGGDFYDAFEIPGGRIGILVGDVSGKGIEAARLTSLVRDGVRAYAYERSDPSWVLERVNGLVYRSSQIGEFATVLFAVLDPEFDRLSYCSAGHPAAALCHCDAVRLLDGGFSPIVGAFPTAEYASSTVDFVPGDRLTLYTDGVTEARCDGEQFGDERLMRVLRKLRRARTERMPQALLDEVRKFTGGPLPDDIVILVVERK